ncbi:MAG: hypothetical protein ACE5IQ_09975 [Candidatus Methylomirabilales bacterium]
MAEDQLLRLLAMIEQAGVWLSVLAWFSVAGGTAAMSYVLRTEKRRGVWVAAGIVGGVALVANLADYVVTLYRTPNLGLEANPLWHNVVEHFGVWVAKWYGLTGKIFVSILAGQMFAFYLANRKRLFPVRAGSLTEFLFRIGNRSKTLRERLAALFTVFAFFFAGVQLFYFYIAYLNWLLHSELRNRLPSVPVALSLLLCALAIAFVAVTYRGFSASSPPEARKDSQERRWGGQA